MPCLITKGSAILQCKDSAAGLKAIYISNFGDYTYTAGAAGTSTEQTILTISGTLAKFYKFELKNKGNVLNQDSTGSSETGTTMWTQTATFILTKLNFEAEYQLKMATYGRPQIIVEGNSGDMILIGMNRGCDVNYKAEIQGAIDALNGYTVTAVAEEATPYMYLTATAATYVKTNVATANF